MMIVIIPMISNAETPTTLLKKKVFELTNEAREESGYYDDTWYPAVKELGWKDDLEEAEIHHAKDML
ncbi:unnamed protein product [Rotaria sp. Silwood2]|nr:unnamed protein product [Rotaria sp. Silwood2]CAF2490888.1 unnamed protein product [Rotaria sp. Silwood2]CAF2721084.1 unnamed protein product [Rotaria sp. Silwood2]CAF3913517.1 unnamed protein product [Rotaria sp. Silwood2]CAF3964839.1 unnamed protein product [Rotaria sp. Silwood2]